MRASEKPFTEVLLESPQYSLALSPLDNVFANLARAQEKVQSRRQDVANLEKYRRAAASMRPPRSPLPQEDWARVPAKVASLYRELQPRALAACATYWDLPGAILLDPTSTRAIHTLQPADHAGWISIKPAALLARPAAVFTTAQSLLGGPGPLSKALVGGLFGSGLGYLSGAALERLLPARQFPGRKRLRRTLAAVGGGFGALPGVWDTSIALRDPSILDLPAKTADDLGELAGTAFAPSIPVDAFNNAIWNDVRTAGNPFGAKSPWGSNAQGLYTPAPVAAVASGLVSGAAAARGGSAYVSPWDVGVTAAAAGGLGVATGLLIGKTLGALAGLAPEYQATLQRAGLWGGILTSVVGRLL